MVNGLDIIAIGIKYKGTVIVRMIDFAYAGRAVVAGTGCNGRGIKGIDPGALRSTKRDRYRRLECLLPADPEFRFCITKTGPAFNFL